MKLRPAVFLEIRRDSRFEFDGFADIENFALAVFENVDAGLLREVIEFFLENVIHIDILT